MFLFLLLIFPLIIFTFSSIGLSRWNQVSIFTSPQKNKTALTHITQNYLSHFSLDFLFLKGDIDMLGQFITRHSIRGMGELYFFQFPLLILGAMYLIKTKQWKIFSVLLLWLFLYPVGSMFTINISAQATRSLIGVIPFQILSAVGLYYFIHWILQGRKRHPFLFPLSIAASSTIFVISFLYFIYLYFVHYPTYSSGYWGWQYGFKNSLIYLAAEQQRYDTLFITHRYNDPETLLKFYTLSYNCRKCAIMTNPISIKPQQKQLFALRIDDIYEAKLRYPDKKFIINKIIYLPSGQEEIFIGYFYKQH